MSEFIGYLENEELGERSKLKPATGLVCSAITGRVQLNILENPEPGLAAISGLISFFFRRRLMFSQFPRHDNRQIRYACD
jgi:hypothetical protein